MECVKVVTERDTKEATKVSGGYVCPDGYAQNGKTCTKVTAVKDTKNATKVTSYSCPSGYSKNNQKCTKTSTENVKVTYYRYATRSCTGGSTKYEWSTSNNDKSLTSAGYKLTGNKREIVVK